ncbi:MAG: YncE family protein [Cyclonatronaceae bacterium]
MNSSKSDVTDHKMYVFSNTAQKFYLIDYRNFEIVKEIPLQMPYEVSEEISRLAFMTLSTGGDHLFFEVTGTWPEPSLGFARYDIGKEEFTGLFYTEFIRSGPTRFIAAQDGSAPGLIFAHLRDYGTYAIDLFEEQVKETISEEHHFRLQKWISHSPDDRWTVVHNIWSGTGGYDEIQFYRKDSGFRDLIFTLSEGGSDSIAIYDFEFSKDGERLFLTYQLSDGRSRNIESYFGSYDLETGKLAESDLRFPWSLNPYYTAYSPKRNEVYTIGAYQEFHILNVETHEREKVIVLSGKTQGSSRIQLTPDENIAFISCALDNSIFVIDLNMREVVHTIDVLERPYIMIIP